MVDLDDFSDAQKGGACIFCVLLIISAGLFGGSFAVVEPNFVGLDYNGNTLKIDRTKVFEPGRYLSGLGHRFITYPTTYQTIEFGSGPGAFSGDLEVFSSEGQSIELQVSFMYRLPTSLDKLLMIYENYEQNEEQAYAREGTTSIKNTATGYLTAEYYSKRQNISERMLEELAKDLSAPPKYAQVRYLQLRNIGIPDSIEDKVIDTVVTEQEMKTAQEAQEVTVIQSQTKVIESEADAKITEALATAQGRSFEFTEAAKAAGVKTVLNSESTAFKDLATNLQFNSTELLNFIWTRTIRDSEGSTTLLVGFKDKSTILSLSGG